MDDQVLTSTMILIALLANTRILHILALQKATEKRNVRTVISFQVVRLASGHIRDCLQPIFAIHTGSTKSLE